MFSNKLSNTKTLRISLLLLALSPSSAQALSSPEQPIAATQDNWQDDSWGDEKISPWQTAAFIELGYGGFLQNNIVASQSSLAELRTRLELGYSHQHFEVSAKGDALYDNVLSNTQWQTRELTFSATPFAFLDVKMGRQVLTWGTGDYLFLNDLFAKDWQSFFSGRDDEYLKAPSDSVRTTWYLGGFTLDLAWTPHFTADKYLTGERFSFYSPQAKHLVAPAENFKVNTTSSSQWSSRLATTKNGVEYAMYGYRGFWPVPVGTSTEGQTYFPSLNVWGASMRMALGHGVFNSEYAFYDSNIPPEEQRSFSSNSQQRLLLGYETEVVKNVTASVQYYLEHQQNYETLLNAGNEQVVDKNRQLLTLRLTYLTMQQKLRWSLFMFYSPTDADGYLKPSLNYRQNDTWSYAMGANIFWGKHNFSFFGQHETNSNAWLRVRAQF